LATADGIGGFASQATFVKQVRAQNKNVLVLHAGDVNTGSALSNMFSAEPDIRSLNAIGYDAVTLGNHEFDGPLEKLRKQIAISKFQWISANIKQGNKYLVKPYIIRNYDGFRVAVIGLTTRRTLTIASPDRSLTFTDEIETAKQMVELVRGKEHADIVIVCGHLGDVAETEDHETSVKLAENVPGIDLIVDGHSHSYFAEPKIVNGVPIVTANVYGKYVGDGVMTIRDGKKAGFTWKPVEITAKEFAPDPEVTKLLEPYVAKADAALKDVVLTTTAPFPFGLRLTRYQEMASGDVLCDGMVAYCRNQGIGIDCAVTNGGGIRSELPAGNVTRGDILTMLPFDNVLFVLTLKGSDVIELFNFIGSVKQGAGAWAQVSKEVKYTITYDAAGNGTLSGLTINGAPVDPDKTYKIATNDYMAGGGDGYVAFKKSIDTFNSSMLLSSVFVDYVKSFKGAFTPVTDGRITVIGSKLPE
ncbi:MAG TPA: bifunctional metallophosphatase/5'-nucleotidase, partial [Treponema sp.]|nr:bifunctional metallophosphatase/5'-nucleotidase [Treponema sp.]